MIRFCFAMAAGIALGLLSPGAAAAQQCISKAARERLESCPAGIVKQTSLPQLPRMWRPVPGGAAAAKQLAAPIAQDPRAAYATLRARAGDDSQAFRLMADLGQRYLAAGQHAEAIVLYRELIRRDPAADRLCSYQAQITAATMALPAGRKVDVLAALEKQLKVYRHIDRAQLPAKVKRACAEVTVAQLLQTAIVWDLEATGTGGASGTADPQTLAQAERLYQLVLDSFAGQLDQLSLPAPLAAHRPMVAKIRFALGDVLYQQQRWQHCGQVFDELVTSDPDGPLAGAALHAALRCYLQLTWRRAFTGYLPKVENPRGGHRQARFEPRPLTDVQQRMVRIFHRYLCHFKPPKTDTDAFEQLVEVKYARARLYLQAQHWEEAAVGFREVAVDHADNDAGAYAAQLYLEALNVLGTKTPASKPSCFAKMGRDVPILVDKYCSKSPATANDELCAVLTRIQRDVVRLEAESLIRQADAGGPQAGTRYEAAASKYLSIWQRWGEQACLDQQAGCQRQEEILYNAARALRAARQPLRAIDIYRILSDPRYRLDHTEPARRAVYEIGVLYQTIASYDLAASYYERFAASFPKMERAPEALTDALIMRLALGATDQAVANAELFSRLYGARRQHGARAAQHALAIAEHLVGQRHDLHRADQHLTRAIGLIDQRGAVDTRVLSHALLARILTQTRPADADGEIAQVLAFWNGPKMAATTLRQLDDLGGSEAVKLRRLGKVLTAVGEAMFLRAEASRAAAAAIAAPVYQGSGSPASIEKFTQEQVKPWIEKKQLAIEAASQQYLQIVAIRPAPPPRWVVESGAAVGSLWSSFALEIAQLPHPKQWDLPGRSPHGADPLKGAPALLWSEIRAAYKTSLEGYSRPYVLRAKAAFETCLAYSVKYQLFTDRSQDCVSWLTSRFPDEHPPIEELGDAPTRVNSPLGERFQALDEHRHPVRPAD